MMVSSVRTVLMSVLPQLTASPIPSWTSSSLPHSQLCSAQAPLLGSTAKDHYMGQKPGGMCFWYLYMPGEINALQYCEFWSGYTVKKNQKEVNLPRCFHWTKSVE